jgi:sialic acid synthase SpsE
LVNNFKSKYLKKSKFPYFISEIGINHNGKLALAIEMIKQSKNAGFDAVKFQKRDAKDLLNFNLKAKKPIGYLSKSKFDIPKKIVKFGKWVYPDTRLELKKNDYKKIKNFCKKIKIDLIITPWDEKSTDFVCQLGVKVIKIASIDANNFHFCDYIARKKKPTIISTGMCTFKELKVTDKIFKKYKTPHMFLHCTSSYPSSEKDKNLLCIPELKKIFKTDIGFSGHGQGFAGSVGAIALGANVVEKHCTLNKKMAGPDHAASLEFEDLKQLIELSKKVKESLGSEKKKLLKSEKVLHSILSRRLVARKNIPANSSLKMQDLKPVLVYASKGFQTNQLNKLLRKKVRKNVNKAHIFTSKDIKV